MQFPVVFSRLETALPDSTPTGLPIDNTKDNVFSCRLNNINGWPPQRIVVLGTYVGAGTPTDVPCDLYFFERGTGTWYKMNASVVNVKLTIRATPNGTPSQFGVIAYFDCPVLMDLPNTSAGGGGGQAKEYSPGAIDCMLVAGAPGTKPAGTYTFAIAADMTTSP